MREVRKLKIDILLIIIALSTSLCGFVLQIYGICFSELSLTFAGQAVFYLGLLIYFIQKWYERFT